MEVKYKGKSYTIPDAHPAANCLPWNLDSKDFEDLVESIRGGFDESKPVMFQDSTDQIISGRRRLLACEITGVDPETKTVRWSDEEIIAYVRRDELYRRSLDPTQYAATLVKLNTLNANGTNQHEKKANEGTSADVPSKTLKEIAEESKVSKPSVERMAKLKKTAPELLDAVQEKKLPINTAVRAADELTPTQIKKIANADKPKEEALKLLGPEKPKPPKGESNPNRGGNSFDFGANAKPEEPKPVILQTPKGEIAFDAFGRAMPNGIGDYFGSTVWQEIIQDGEGIIAMIEGFKAGVEKAQSGGWLWIDSLKIIKKSAEMRNDVVKLLDIIRGGLPFALCGRCDGKKCQHCNNSGYVPKGVTDLDPELYAGHKRKAG